MTHTLGSRISSGIRRRLKTVFRLFSFPMRRIFGTVMHVETKEAIAALTFDDGPHPNFTPRLLEILEKHNAKATFFLVGESAAQYPELVEQIALAGHSIGNHSWNHPSFPLISGNKRRRQIRRCEEVTSPYGQKLFRPPFGHQTLASRLDALLCGYKVIAWSVVGLDWLDHDANQIVDDILSQLRPGSIILLHDALYVTEQQNYASREATIEAVDLLLENQRNKFSFLTVPELINCGQPEYEFWGLRADDSWLNNLEKVNK